jgi:hypothetical protein
MEAIRSTLDDGEGGAAEIRAAARRLEQVLPVAEVLAAVADPEFPGALVGASRSCEALEERAWLTLAAASPRRVRQVLAWRASQMLDPAELAAVARKRRSATPRKFEQLAAAAEDPGAAAAWRVLVHLRRSELRALVRARPALFIAFRHARSSRAPIPALGVG